MTALADFESAIRAKVDAYAPPPAIIMATQVQKRLAGEGQDVALKDGGIALTTGFAYEGEPDGGRTTLGGTYNLRVISQAQFVLVHLPPLPRDTYIKTFEHFMRYILTNIPNDGIGITSLEDSDKDALRLTIAKRLNITIQQRG